MTRRVVAVVQARTGSSRLPGKCLRPMGGKPMILQVLDRVASAGFDDVVLATSTTEPDAGLAACAIKAGYEAYCGSEWDVLSRVYEAAIMARADVVVRVTGDCPLWAPDIGLQVLKHWDDSGGFGIATNDTRISGWPDGMDTEVFPVALLADAYGLAHDVADREHVTPWMRRHAPHHVLRCEENWRAVKLSVDDAAEFERAAAVMGALRGRHKYEWSAVRDAVRSLMGRL